MASYGPRAVRLVVRLTSICRNEAAFTYGEYKAKMRACYKPLLFPLGVLS